MQEPLKVRKGSRIAGSVWATGTFHCCFALLNNLLSPGILGQSAVFCGFESGFMQRGMEPRSDRVRYAGIVTNPVEGRIQPKRRGSVETMEGKRF